MSDDISNSVDKQDYEEFKKKVIDVLGILVQAFDKNVNVAKTSQASLNNLTETIQDLAKMHQMDYEDVIKLLKEIRENTEKK